jgi:hemerythrin superfamily protein
MIFRPLRFKIVALLSLLVLVSMTAGFFLGAIFANVINKKKENPAYWKQAAMKHLEKLKPDAEQKKRFEVPIDAAVKDLSELRQQAIKDIWKIVDQAVIDIEKDLKPEQRETFEKIKPKAPPEAK